MDDSSGFQIGRLPQMRIARCKVKAENPETKAFEKVILWAERNDAAISKETRFFGFNDPCPKPGQKVYEYEAWMSVDPGVTGSEDVEVFEFPGGTYAVRETRLSQIGDAWHSFGLTVKQHGYHIGHGPALEEAVTHPLKTPFESAVMILYLPIETKDG